VSRHADAHDFAEPLLRPAANPVPIDGAGTLRIGIVNDGMDFVGTAMDQQQRSPYISVCRWITRPAVGSRTSIATRSDPGNTI
jgi:hypothetical protein